MTLMDQTQGSEMDRLWALLSELSSQLSHNRQQTEELHRRADELKAQAVHAQTGFTLRRFNLDVSQEEFESELERLNVQLVTENQALQQENRQLSSLLKDYESTLEAVMGKFRAHAHATQQHHLDLTRHYESLLLSVPSALPPPSDKPADPTNPEAPPIDPEHLQLSLSHLASLIRKALRAMQGEDPDDSTSPLLLPMGIGEATSALSDALRRGAGARDPLDGGADDAAGGPPSPTSSIGSFSSIASSAAVPPPSHFGSEPDLDRLLASHHPSTSRSRALESEGGYVSKRATTDPLYIPTTSVSSLVLSPPRPGQARDVEDEMASRGLGPLDEALQRDVELEALRRENEELKKLLRISEMELDDERNGGAVAEASVASMSESETRGAGEAEAEVSAPEAAPMPSDARRPTAETQSDSAAPERPAARAPESSAGPAQDEAAAPASDPAETARAGSEQDFASSDST
ncbi:hypothetical protein JCM8202_005682 [Rhodotorula sphaerocarpa]